MVEFKIRINEAQHTAYFPKEIYKALGSELRAVANRCAVIIFPENTSTEDVIRSLEIIKADLEHAKQLQHKKEAT